MGTTESQTEISSELQAASAALDVALGAFVAAGNAFVEAGGDQMELLRRFQSAVMG